MTGVQTCALPIFLGLAVIADDVPADLASAAIASIEVLGSLQASPAVKRVLADRLP